MNALELADKLINYPCSKASLETAAGEMLRAQHEAIRVLREALGEIEWSNDSKWQSDRARAALAATENLHD